MSQREGNANDLHVILKLTPNENNIEKDLSVSPHSPFNTHSEFACGSPIVCLIPGGAKRESNFSRCFYIRILCCKLLLSFRL